MRGWHDGQADNAPLLKRAEEIMAERAKPAAEPEDEAEGEGDEPEFDADKEARRLKGSDFMDRSSAEEQAAA
jgi:hypothetical protein